MRKLALFILPALFLSLAGTAHAAAVSKALQKAADASFRGFKAQKGQYGASYKGDRLQISSNGKTANVAIQYFGRSPGPMRLKPLPAAWHNSNTATFKKAADGKWSKVGRWNTIYYALGAAK